METVQPVARVFAFVFVLIGVHLASRVSAHARDPRISVEATLSPDALGPGEAGRLDLIITVPDGWHLWGLDPGPGPLPLTVHVPDAVIELDGPFFGDEPVREYDRGFERQLLRYPSGPTKIGRRFVVARDAPAQAHVVEVVVRGQICTDAQCVGQHERVTAPLIILDSPAGRRAPAPFGASLSVRLAAGSAGSAGEGAQSRNGAPTAQLSAAALNAAKREGLIGFMLIAFLFGLGALATPCVFPAIPLTVSFFSKYSKVSVGRGARLAAVYAFTMVAAFTVAGVVVSVIFGVSGIQRFASHPVFNVLLGVMLAFFALNLLGLFELRAPAFMTWVVNRLEARFGRAARTATEGQIGGLSDYLVVAVAALTATTVFFTCTVAFVGLVLVEAARGEWFWPTMGMVAFASAFALPFFLLALFPQGARWLQGRTGSWLGATRVTLGFLELVAATKFFSNADLVWNWGLLTREVVLVVWVPLFVMCAFYLLGKFRIGQETLAKPEGGVSVLQLLASTAMFALSLYLAAGLFNGRPFGGWLDGWLPPVVYPGRASGAAPGDGALEWHHSLESGRVTARANGTLVFVNYTGFSCTNCRYMEGGMFPRPQIAKILRTMTLVELYTDGVGPEHAAAREDQVTRFGTAALPLYSVELADGTIIASFPSSTNDPEEFRRFLAEAVEEGRRLAARGANPPPRTSGSDGDALLWLKTTRLSDGEAHPAVAAGKWSLVNFWATWCSPCKVELREFMVDMGRDLETKGGRFAAVAVEEETSVPLARKFMNAIRTPANSALRLPADLNVDLVDPKLGFDGSTLPYTILVSPGGEVVWKQYGTLREDELRGVLVEHLGDAARPPNRR